MQKENSDQQDSNVINLDVKRNYFCSCCIDYMEHRPMKENSILLYCVGCLNAIWANEKK